LQAAGSLADSRLEAVDVYQAADARMCSGLSHDHPSPAVTHEHARAGPIENQARGGDVGGETGEGFLHDLYGIAVVSEDIGDRLPTRTIRKRAMDQNHTLDGTLRDRRNNYQ
jgi:hypothetical protein